MKFLRLFLLCVALLPGLPAQAQQVIRCVTDEAEARNRKLNPSQESRAVFEKWLSARMTALRQAATPFRPNETVYRIPVVVHIIHNGEAVGVGSNISDAQVLSQIQVLNEDFRRKNADAANTRPVFLPVAADCSIEFQLAVTDPDGIPTTGIRRVKGTQTAWNANSTADNINLKATDYWDSRFYYNLWVCNLTNGSDPTAILGYAQYPQSDLPGLRDQDLGSSNKNPLTDGVVINYRYFGTSTNTKYGKGRTTTHETGHYLGLYHPWGSSGGKFSDCSDTDYCNDTPTTGIAYYDCQTAALACDGKTPAMVEDYMDYSDDACFNAFTLGQKARMRTVLENSPRRLTLLNSPGLIPAPPISNDAGIRAVLQPAEQIYCNTQLVPKIVLRNYGNNPLTKVNIVYQVDKEGAKTLAYTGNLAAFSNDTLALPAYNLASGKHTFKVYTALPNGTADNRRLNDTLTTAFEIATVRPVPFEITFDKEAFPPAGWSLYNPDYDLTWEKIQWKDSLNVADTAIYVDCFEYQSKGEKDFLYSASYDFSGVNFAELSFEVSYAQYLGTNGAEGEDGLQVLISTDCGNSYSILYQKSGAALATAKPVNKAWLPASKGQWRTERQNLKDFINQKNVKLAFVSLNDYGNNLYLNNLKVNTLTINEELYVYPNPSADGSFNVILNLKEKQPVVLTLYDALGKLVYQNTYNNVSQENLVLGVPSLTSGLYILKASGSSFSATKRVLIQR